MVAVISILVLLEVAFNLVSWALRRQPVPCTTAGSTCYTLAALRVGYGIQPLLERGIDGRGQTVMIIANVAADELPAYGPFTDIRSDLRAFDALQDLPPAHLSVSIVPHGTKAPAFLADSEERLDVEMVHAIAPGATIRVEQVGQPVQNYAPRWNGFLVIDMLDAVLEDPDPPDVLSISYGWSERCFTAAERSAAHVLLREIVARGTTVVAMSGDGGVSQFACGVRADGRYLVNRSVAMPAADPLVTAVGGTSLELARPTGRYVSEIAWNELPSPTADPRGFWAESTASGGGYSSNPAPAYQLRVIGRHRGRGVPDVAADADVWTGIDTVLVEKSKTVYSLSTGTSASTPLWAGIIALADQYAHRRLGAINPVLYRIATNPRDRGAFHPVTSGDNSVQFLSGPPMVGYLARAPWSPVTGLGSPVASRLVPLLAASTAGR